MDEQIKNTLGKAVIAALVVFSASAAWYVYSYSQYYQPSPQRMFSVSATGKATVIPDIAQLTFSVITEGGSDAAALQKDNTERTNSAIAFVKAAGVEDKDIKTKYYSVDPRYEYCDYSDGGVCPPPTIVGYTITHTVSVKVRDLNKAGELLSGIVDNGANSVSQLSFTLDDPTLAENQARDQAIAKAREKAESVAKAGNVKLGKLLSIQQGSGYGGDLYGYGIGGGGVVPMGKESIPELEPGSQEVTVTITLQYEMK